MIKEVETFLRVNWPLLDKDMIEFFHIAHNGLTRYQMDELVAALDKAAIETLTARETVLRFVITMETEVLEKSIPVITFANRYIKGALGFSTEDIVEYIMENSNEWDVNIVFNNGDYWLDPSAEFVDYDEDWIGVAYGISKNKWIY